MHGKPHPFSLRQSNRSFPDQVDERCLAYLPPERTQLALTQEEQAVSQRRLWLARPRMCYQSRRLAHHDQIFILVDRRQTKINGTHRQRISGWKFESNNIPAVTNRFFVTVSPFTLTSPVSRAR